MTKKIRVLVVDDSALMRKKITEMISADAECEVIAAARNGEEAIKAVSILRPDVVTLDIQMPRMDGLTCLGYIMSEWPTPVVMLSAFTHYGGEGTVKALELGAVDFVTKPGGVISLDIAKVKDELIAKIKTAAKVEISKLKLLMPRMVQPVQAKPFLPLNKVVVIAGSTGGPRALVEILSKLPADIPAGILVVQHMPPDFTRSMAERLNGECLIKVKEAEEGEPIEAGKALIAPGGFQMVVEQKGNKEVVKSSRETGAHRISPAADITMCSLAPVYREKAIGIVVTGMGRDGTDGLKAIKEHGGYTIAEDKSTCIVYGMPKAAVDAGVVDKIVPLPGIADEIVKLVINGK